VGMVMVNQHTVTESERAVRSAIWSDWKDNICDSGSDGVMKF